MDNVKNKKLEFLRDLKVRLETKKLRRTNLQRFYIILYSKILGKDVSHI